MLRLARVAAVVGFDGDVIHNILSHRGTKAIAAALIVIAFAGAGLTLIAERDAPGANIRTFPEAIWWATSTMTTVASGDYFPTTAAGRGVAVALMLFGIATFSSVTAAISAFLVREQQEDVSMNDLLAKLQDIERELAALREVAR